MKMAKPLLLAIVCACSAALGQATSSAALEDYTLKLRLSPGLVINCPIFGGHTPEGRLIGDYEFRSSITGNSTQGLTFDWNMTQPSNYAGRRQVRNEDLRQSRKVSVYYWNGENGARTGYSDTLRISDVIFSELKQGKKTAFEFDGNENPQSIQLVGTEYLTALVNERRVRIRTLKGKTPNGWYFWVLDNPVFPMLVKGDASWHWTVPSFTYPETSIQRMRFCLLLTPRN